MRVLRQTLSLVCLLGFAAIASAVTVKPDIAYRADGKVDAGFENCRVDLYVPDGPVIGSLLWLHGGGLTGGSRNSAATQRIGRRLAESGILVASAGYRFSPGVNFPEYLRDTAAVTAWLHANAAKHGGDSARIFLGGHSAGAYLALMVALDDSYLAGSGFAAKDLAGVIAISGQTTTHFTVRAERQIPESQMIVDAAAPLYHVKQRAYPFLILYAGSDMALRIEENRLLAGALRGAKTTVEDELFADRDHGTIISKMGEPGDAVAARIVEFVRGAKRP